MASRGIAAFFAHAQGEHADCVLYYYTDSPADCKGESLKNRKKSKRGRVAAPGEPKARLSRAGPSAN